MRALVLSLIMMVTTLAHADGTADPLDGVDESAVNVGEGDSPLGQRLSERMGALQGALDDAGAAAGAASGVISGVGALTDLFQALSDLDGELDGRTGNDGAGPSVPSSCADNGACNECFTRAYGEVNFVRNTLERLRTISKRTIAFIQRAEGFGDSVSGVHGVSGLAWQYSKAGIEQERANFNRSTREKYNALIQSMQRNLQAVSECERQHFNNPDWYNRYGFMYFNFVKEAYQPAE
ncbi:MAG: hypothetical protein H0T42_14375 [Deltaproteobacteria bacterium]|nr:hypothetical protein [Deltaproteobacteria bacterium]